MTRSSLASIRGQGRAAEVRKRVGGETSPERKKYPKGTLWPNGQFSVGWAYRTQSQKATPSEEWAWVGRSEATPPNLVSGSKSSQGRANVKSKYGSKGITGYGKKMVRNSALLIQRVMGRRGVCFGTLTLPALDESGLLRVAERWGEVTRQTLQWLARRLTQLGASPKVCFVTEVQPLRLAERDELAYHLHFVCQLRVGKSYALNASDLREFWDSLIERVSGQSVGPGRISLEVVRGNAEGYIGKYMSKGASEVFSIVERFGERYLPGSWWGMTRDARRLVNASVQRGFGIGGVLLDLIELMLESKQEDYAGEMIAMPILVEVDGRRILMGWAGRVSGDSLMLALTGGARGG